MWRDYVDWWAGQMLDLVPERVRQSFLDTTDALLVQPRPRPLGDTLLLDLFLARGGRVTGLGQFAGDLAGMAHARQVLREAGNVTAVRLRLDGDVLLEKTLTLPLAAERELDRVLAYEMDRETPFSPDEVWWSFAVLHRDRAQSKLRVRLSVVPKAALSELTAALGQLQLRPTVLDILLPEGGFRQIPLDEAGRQTKGWRGRAVPLAASACALLALVAGGLPFAIQAAQLSSTKARMAALKPAVSEAEKLREQLEGAGKSDILEAQRARYGDPIKVLAAATTLLPDDTFLTDFTMQQRRITMNGQSIGPAKLIGALAADPTFKDPAFAAPSTHAEGAHTDTFSISAEARP